MSWLPQWGCTSSRHPRTPPRTGPLPACASWWCQCAPSPTCRSWGRLRRWWACCAWALGSAAWWWGRRPPWSGGAPAPPVCWNGFLTRRTAGGGKSDTVVHKKLKYEIKKICQLNHCSSSFSKIRHNFTLAFPLYCFYLICIEMAVVTHHVWKQCVELGEIYSKSSSFEWKSISAAPWNNPLKSQSHTEVFRQLMKPTRRSSRSWWKGRILVRAQWTQSFSLSKSYITLKNDLLYNLHFALLYWWTGLFTQAWGMRTMEKCKKNNLDCSEKDLWDLKRI